MMGGMGGTSGSPGTGQVFLPPGQPEAAAELGQIAGPLFALSANAGAGTPAGQNYPTAQDFVSRYLTGTGGGATGFNDMLTRAFNPAYSASVYGTDLMNRGAAQGDYLNTLGVGAVPYAQQSLAQGFDPAYEQAVAGIQNNPYFAHQLAGAREAATMGGQGGYGMQDMAQRLQGTVDPLIQSGFDPQSALFNRSRSQLMDQTNAINAMSGLAGTPYGASVSANAMGRFENDWQNQQLARQAQAAGAAGQTADRAGLLYGMAPGLAQSSAAMPSNAITGQMNQVLQALGARNQGAQQGLSSYGAGTGTVGSAFQGAQGLGSQGAQLGMQLGAAPYNLGTGIASNALSGLTNATTLGNNQYALPNQQLGNLMQYMGLGQNAAQAQGNLQNQQFNQMAQGIGGGLSAANQLFGSGGMFGGGSGLGGLFGGAGAGLDFGGGGTGAFVSGLGGVPAAAEAGSGFGSLFPLALSGA